jgi:hypothetical protein
MLRIVEKDDATIFGANKQAQLDETIHREA